MIPSLSLIVAAYTAVRLLDLVVNRLTGEDRTDLDIIVAVAGIAAILVIFFAAIDIFNAASKTTEALEKLQGQL